MSLIFCFILLTLASNSMAFVVEILIANGTDYDEFHYCFESTLINQEFAENSEVDIYSEFDDTRIKSFLDICSIKVFDSHFKDTPVNVFKKFENLIYINIDNTTGFRFLNSSYFSEKMLRINISGTDLEEVGENAFVGLTNLAELQLSHCSVLKVHKNAFRGLVNLEGLILRDNSIDHLEEEIFEHCINLTYVELYNNKIKVITAKLFSNNVKLQVLGFGKNQISQIEQGFFEKLPKLKYADFEGNLCIDETIKGKYFFDGNPEPYPEFHEQLKNFTNCFNNFALTKSTKNE